MKQAGNNQYAFRFYDSRWDSEIYANNSLARPGGQYLAETFTPLTNRNNMAIAEPWNNMQSLQQWQIKPKTIMITGVAAPQYVETNSFIGQTHYNTYTGGVNQIFIYQPWRDGSLILPQ